MQGAIVITGASTGIGAACARYLDGLGFTVWAGVRRKEDGEALARSTSARLRVLLLDVTDSDSITEASRTLTDALPEAGLAGLVNNAGISVAGPLELLPIAEVRTQFEVNVIGALAVTQALLPLLRRARGRIVNISSIAGLAATPFLGAYCSSKFALEAMSDALRLELAPWGIAVALVEPGAIQSQIWQRATMSATRTLGGVAPESLALYAQSLARMQDVMAGAAARAIPAEAVAQVVARALTVPSPRARYLVGKDARFRAVLKWLLPDSAQDRLLTWFLGLSRHA
ncbi:MAG: SDR family oxidoreductase [Nitrospira sp.]|nr:SDR family oxidoreductase [Nitrospira sp.]MCW5793429.1 SDR family oxidoreductase [Nitrospira sp.]HMW86742.1 SDR family oxidoreductase [Nitrospira sp.]HMZ97091.1 SDR family oxidoreductase [Nitrospira sp.]HNA47586.1 SDR family oxidoreductase [Nitrospira sp.]